MISINGKEVNLIFEQNQEIDKIYKGTLLVYGGWRELIASGVPPLTLTKCKNDYLIDYKIYGNSVQNGTPTPEAPIEVESVGDKTSNLFNQFTTKTAYFSDVSNSYARTFEEGVWYRGLTYNNYSYPQNLLDYNVGTSTTMVKVNGQLLYGLAQAFRVEPNQIYSFSYDDGDGGTVTLGFYDKDGNILSFKYLRNEPTIKIPANTYWMTICLSGADRKSVV